jgi:hypothetical protein
MHIISAGFEVALDSYVPRLYFLAWYCVAVLLMLNFIPAFIVVSFCAILNMTLLLNLCVYFTTAEFLRFLRGVEEIEDSEQAQGSDSEGEESLEGENAGCARIRTFGGYYG